MSMLLPTTARWDASAVSLLIRSLRLYLSHLESQIDLEQFNHALSGEIDLSRSLLEELASLEGD